MNILVFDTDTQGKHRTDSAKEAMRLGAEKGFPRGRRGDTYAIVTKELRRRDHPTVMLDHICVEVAKFLAHARANPDDFFMVTPIGCGPEEFQPKEIAPMFKDAPDNVRLPLEFRQ